MELAQVADISESSAAEKEAREMQQAMTSMDHRNWNRLDMICWRVGFCTARKLSEELKLVFAACL
jgi:hypothetical protein